MAIESPKDKLVPVISRDTLLDRRKTPRNQSIAIEMLPSRPPATNGRLFTCGWPNPQLQRSLFPEYTNRTERYSKQASMGSQPSDVLFFGMHGPCGTPKFGPHKIGPAYVAKHFRGAALFVNKEPFGDIREDINDTGIVSHKMYQIGRIADADDLSGHSIQVFPVAVAFCLFPPSVQQHLLDPIKKPTYNQTYPNGLIYVQTHCVGYREQAMADLSRSIPNLQIYHGPCRGKKANGVNSSALVPLSKSFLGNRQAVGGKAGFRRNIAVYRMFKFCLVMDNVSVDGYISEKILLAFLSGCIPIYYGTPNVFDIFHKDAFVYYNISQPEPALDLVRELHQNSTRYRKMQSTPILANGDQTLEDFFSLDDRIGQGKLKKRIRAMMQLPAC